MLSPSNLLFSLYSAAQVREMDRLAIEENGYEGLTLMKMAGQRAFDQIQIRFPDVKKIIVACGAGNNGGDGYVIARLGMEAGMEVSVVQVAGPATNDANTVCREYLAAGGRIESQWNSLSRDDLADTDLVVDALLGTGLNRAPGGIYGEMIREINTLSCPMVAVDVPSGLNADTGDIFDPCIKAAMTVTFIGLKFGMVTGPGREVCGEVRYESLDLPQEMFDALVPLGHLIDTPSLSKRMSDVHKGQCGHVLVAGGDEGMLGAVMLAGRAAMRCGSGLVSVLSTRSHLDMPALQCNELMSLCLENESVFQSVA